ncbi:hypothetical protein NDU88_001651 [Pleurodeles waltl]|uniref:Reverse transcriptase RNase H-like domain-containing protein n=1 Tax=Pleurodeles waltl TaxID=8319 RepID=A0AAV7Q6N7_PLEWA|nr:hypothetical protein NDU88_001651 [Pleurodeles waltl]
MYGLGAVLMQVHNGKERVVAFASRTLKGAETTYSAVEKEALACWWGITYFKNYVWGRSFELRTDHKPLVDIFTTAGASRASSRIAKWLYRLQEYTFTVKYLPGIMNVNADCLSRLPLENVCGEEEEEWVVADLQDIKTKAISEEVWKAAVQEDTELQAIIRNLHKCWSELGDETNNFVIVRREICCIVFKGILVGCLATGRKLECYD